MHITMTDWSTLAQLICAKVAYNITIYHPAGVCTCILQ